MVQTVVQTETDLTAVGIIAAARSQAATILDDARHHAGEIISEAESSAAFHSAAVRDLHARAEELRLQLAELTARRRTLDESRRAAEHRLGELDARASQAEERYRQAQQRADSLQATAEAEIERLRAEAAAGAAQATAAAEARAQELVVAAVAERESLTAALRAEQERTRFEQEALQRQLARDVERLRATVSELERQRRQSDRELEQLRHEIASIETAREDAERRRLNAAEAAARAEGLARAHAQQFQWESEQRSVVLGQRADWVEREIERLTFERDHLDANTRALREKVDALQHRRFDLEQQARAARHAALMSHQSTQAQANEVLAHAQREAARLEVQAREEANGRLAAADAEIQRLTVEHHARLESLRQDIDGARRDLEELRAQRSRAMTKVAKLVHQKDALAGKQAAAHGEAEAVLRQAGTQASEIVARARATAERIVTGAHRQAEQTLERAEGEAEAWLEEADAECSARLDAAQAAVDAMGAGRAGRAA